MRGLNLGVLRGRVDRLASACGPQKPDVLLFSWKWGDTRCRGCGYDLREHAYAAARQKAENGGGPFIWVERDDICPRCGGAN